MGFCVTLVTIILLEDIEILSFTKRQRNTYLKGQVYLPRLKRNERNVSEEAANKQLKEFDERCRTLPEYAVYRTKAWLKENATYK